VTPDQLIIEFCHHEDRSRTMELKWEILDSLPALMWTKLLGNCLKNNLELFPRFNGFLNSYKDEPYLWKKLESLVEIINKWEDYPNPIEIGNEKVFSQDLANIIHHHFELLAGEIDNSSDFFKKANPKVRYAISQLNHTIHDMEALYKSQENAKERPEAVVAGLSTEFKGVKRFSFPNEFYDHFSIDRQYGDIVLHYAQIGKTWMEAFLDQDDEIFENAIIPHKFITGEFDIFFGESKISEKQLSDFEVFLKKFGKDINDKKLGIGQVKVARLIREKEWSNSQYNKHISQFMGIRRISIKTGSKSISSMEFKDLDYQSKFFSPGEN